MSPSNFMDNRPVTVGLVQMLPSEDAAASLAKASAMVREAADRDADIVVLPELFLGPYFCAKPGDAEAFLRAEPVPGPATQALSALAKKCGVVLIGGSIFEKAEDGKYFNTCPVFESDGTLLGAYRKTHIPHDPEFYEQDYFAPGDTGIKVFETSAGRIAPLICYDQWFPEAARIATLKGAELIVYPTAIATSPDIPPVTPEIPEDWELMWRSAQVGHAAANNVYVAAVNRAGREGPMHFWGGSFVADPGGRLLAKADDTEQVVLAACDLGHVHRMQESWRFLQERRPDMYGDLTKKQI
ncbi:MAG: N-carbamoylputrescine amidase [Candidatus Peribacteraceae bacterium]|nr:N-carbamoylputrescine amidase [Candidatus Peribacteraceae bacterium]